MVDSRDVFILGAGFSRAVQPLMPTLDDIGESIRNWLLSSPKHAATVPPSIRNLLRRGHVPGGNIEIWLSTLAERQPFLSESANVYNYGLFLDISRKLVELVEEPQGDFMLRAPDWLHRLIRLWHVNRRTVITLNYDTIVEQATEGGDIPGSDGNLTGAILRYIPIPALPSPWGIVPPETFRLLKLHGSIDWHWNPADRTGETVRRLPGSVTEDDAPAALAGSEPFIVPPLATKVPFYSLGLVRSLWSDAARALSIARRIVVLGYSAPLTDLAVTALLSQNVVDSVSWDVVDPKAGEVIGRLDRVGLPLGNCDSHDNISDFVDDYEVGACAGMARRVRRGLPPGLITSGAPILVQKTRSEFAVVTSLSREPDPRASGDPFGHIIGSEMIALQGHPLLAPEELPANLPRERDLVRLIGRSSTPTRMVFRFDGSRREYSVLGASDRRKVGHPNAVLEWCSLEIQAYPLS
jgi:hypothetical protein